MRTEFALMFIDWSTATIVCMKSGVKALLLLVIVLPVLAIAEPRLASIKLPDGFKIEVYADEVENARQMVLGDKGTLFVGSRRKGDVYAISDTDGDQKADFVRVIDSNLSMPSGVEFRDGSLYVGAVNRILRYDNIEERLDFPPPLALVTQALPSDDHHGWKYLRFGPDGMLYIPVGAPCNVCDEADHMHIRRMQSDGSGMEVFAQGIRNSVGLTFHPVSNELWFTVNGRDHMGDDLPSDELNHAPRKGMHFGFPYCHQGDTLDPKFGKGKDCADYEPPAAKLGAHVAPLGLTFYTGDMFPKEFKNQLFIAEHGSWNRSSKVGYQIKLVRFNGSGNVIGQEVFAKGWLQGADNWGRPNDVLQMPDGALLVSDDQNDMIYRISYNSDD